MPVFTQSMDVKLVASHYRHVMHCDVFPLHWAGHGLCVVHLAAGRQFDTPDPEESPTTVVFGEEWRAKKQEWQRIHKRATIILVWSSVPYLLESRSWKKLNN